VTNFPPLRGSKSAREAGVSQYVEDLCQEYLASNVHVGGSNTKDLQASDLRLPILGWANLTKLKSREKLEIISGDRYNFYRMCRKGNGWDNAPKKSFFWIYPQ
jgi:hypothetical protein